MCKQIICETEKSRWMSFDWEKKKTCRNQMWKKKKADLINVKPSRKSRIDLSVTYDISLVNCNTSASSTLYLTPQLPNIIQILHGTTFRNALHVNSLFPSVLCLFPFLPACLMCACQNCDELYGSERWEGGGQRKMSEMFEEGGRKEEGTRRR